jgi:SAM-dependent methyltransferase
MLRRVAERFLTRALRLSLSGLRRGPHITRYYMYSRLAQFRQPATPRARVLSISHSLDLCRLMGLDSAQITEANYPDVDMLSLPFADDSFEYVVSDQVLEHVAGNPQTAIDETVRVVKPGGMVIHTTCFINPIHGAPEDYWRFTPNALTLLCRRCSRIVETGGWGNRYVWVVVGLGLRFEGIPEAQWHPLHRIATLNDPDWPIVTWIIAQK